MSDTVRATKKPLSDLQEEVVTSIKASSQPFIDMLDNFYGSDQTTALARTKIEEAVAVMTALVTG